MSDIPAAVRIACYERDDSCCRLCGRFVEYPHLHHIVYRSQQGQHVETNLISLDHLCHSQHAHGPEAGIWRGYFLRLAAGEPGTALRLRRNDERTYLSRDSG